MPEREPLEIQLDRQGVADLELLASRHGVTPEELAATIMNRALERMTRPPKSRSNVASIGRKG